jgi:hypothetical protein
MNSVADWYVSVSVQFMDVAEEGSTFQHSLVKEGRVPRGSRANLVAH